MGGASPFLDLFCFFFFLNINYILGAQRNKLEYPVSYRRECAMNHNEFLSTRPRLVPTEPRPRTLRLTIQWVCGWSVPSVLSASSAVTLVLFSFFSQAGRRQCKPWRTSQALRSMQGRDEVGTQAPRRSGHPSPLCFPHRPFSAHASLGEYKLVMDALVLGASLVAQAVKNLPAMQETGVRSWGQ